MDFFTNAIARRRQELIAGKEQCERLLKNLPEGSLRISKDHDSYRWVYATNKKVRQLKKKDPKDIELASDLAYKDFLVSQMQDADNQIAAIDAFFEKYKDCSYVDEFFNHPEKRMLYSKSHPIKRDLAALWERAPFEARPHGPEQAEFKTDKGERVCSKSEQSIANIYHRLGIHYRYEMMHDIGGVMYPDFTVRHPATGKLIIHEHFGMWDDADYLAHNLEKLRRYAAADYVPGVNFFMTFESSIHPFDASEFEQMARTFFFHI